MLASDSVRGRFARGAVWSLIGSIFAQTVALAMTVITARLLGSDQFGQYGMIQSTVGMAGIFAGFGLGITTTKHVAEFRTADPERAGRIIALGVVVAAIVAGVLASLLALFAPSISNMALREPSLSDELRIASILLFCNAFNGAQNGCLAGFEAFRSMAYINLARGGGSLLFTATMVVWWGLSGAIWAAVLSAILTCVLTHYSLRRLCKEAEISPRMTDAWKERNVLWAFSAPAFLCGALVGPVTWAANSMLVSQPNGYSEMGVFSAANQYRTAMLFLPSLVSQVTTPILASIKQNNRSQSARRILLAAMAANALCAAPFVIIVIPFSDHFMAIFGPTFKSRGPVLETIVLSGVLLAIQTPVGNLITAFGRLWLGFFMNLGWAAVFVASAYILINKGWGAQGVATAYLTGYAVHTICIFWFAVMLLRPEDPHGEIVSTGVKSIV